MILTHLVPEKKKSSKMIEACRMITRANLQDILKPKLECLGYQIDSDSIELHTQSIKKKSLSPF